MAEPRADLATATDQEVVVLARAGRDPAFRELIRRYERPVFSLIYRMVRDRELAEDLAQETFARAWAAWEDQRDEKAVKAWLFTIARNEHARLYERKTMEIDADVDLDQLAARQASDPGLALDIRKAFAALPDEMREAMLLQVLSGLSAAEIAVTCACSEAAVNMRLSRARKALRVMLDPAIPLSRPRTLSK